MNTTERILSCGSRHPYCAWRECDRYNPFSPGHWETCLANNPGGYVPNHNPTEFDELVGRMASEQQAERSI